jgi:hypothetical protein
MRGNSERGKGGAAGSPVGTIARDILYGALVAAVCTALSFILALAGFGRLYYVAVFLPFFMLVCLLVAWFLYLKDDGFIPSARSSGTAATAADRHGSPSYTGLPANGPEGAGLLAGRPDLSLYAPRGDQLVPRKSDGELGPRNANGGSRSGRGGTAGARRALLWAAVQLGLLAAALYSWAGVGAGYFIPVAR